MSIDVTKIKPGDVVVLYGRSSYDEPEPFSLASYVLDVRTDPDDTDPETGTLLRRGGVVLGVEDPNIGEDPETHRPRRTEYYCGPRILGEGGYPTYDVDIVHHEADQIDVVVEGGKIVKARLREDEEYEPGEYLVGEIAWLVDGKLHLSPGQDEVDEWLGVEQEE
jgi:hypothetical protein